MGPIATEQADALKKKFCPAVVEAANALLTKLPTNSQEEWDVSIFLVENSEVVNEKLIALFKEIGYDCFPRNGHYFLKDSKKS